MTNTFLAALFLLKLYTPAASPMPSVTSTAAYDTPFSSLTVAVTVAVSILLVAGE